MPHGPDAAAPTTSTNQTTPQGAATMAKYTTMRSTLSDTISRVIDDPTAFELPRQTPAVGESARTAPQFPAARKHREHRAGGVRNQGYRAAKRPLRTQGR